MAKTLSSIAPTADTLIGAKSAISSTTYGRIKVHGSPYEGQMGRQKPASMMSPTSEGVRIVTAGEYQRAAACLAEAFSEDEVARYFIDVPDRAHWSEEEKWKLHTCILEYITYAHILKGLVTTIRDFEAVALWMPPGQNMDDYLTVFRSGMWRLNYRLSAEGKRRFFHEFLPLLHDTMSKTLGERENEAWYLVYLGTRPSGRGKGYARKLIEHVTEQADEQGRACYLESSHIANVPIYRKFGFEESRTIFLQRSAKNVSLQIMVREPKGQGREVEAL